MKESEQEIIQRRERILGRLAKRGLRERLRVAAKEHHVLEHDILGPSRQRSVVLARHAFWRALHDDDHLSWPEVATLLEKRHDSIIHATSYKESRQREDIERSVIERVVRYVRRLGFNILAQEIEAGAWRSDSSDPERPNKCTVPSCPRPGLKRLGGRCSGHPA